MAENINENWNTLTSRLKKIFFEISSIPEPNVRAIIDIMISPDHFFIF